MNYSRDSFSFIGDMIISLFIIDNLSLHNLSSNTFVIHHSNKSYDTSKSSMYNIDGFESFIKISCLRNPLIV